MVNYVCALYYELPKDLRLSILGNKGMKRKLQNWMETQVSAHSPLSKVIFGKAVQTYAKADIRFFWLCPILLDFLTLDKKICH